LFFRINRQQLNTGAVISINSDNETSGAHTPYLRPWHSGQTPKTNTTTVIQLIEATSTNNIT